MVFQSDISIAPREIHKLHSKVPQIIVSKYKAKIQEAYARFCFKYHIGGNCAGMVKRDNTVVLCYFCRTLHMTDYKTYNFSICYASPLSCHFYTLWLNR